MLSDRFGRIAALAGSDPISDIADLDESSESCRLAGQTCGIHGQVLLPFHRMHIGGEWHTVIRSPDGIEIPSAYVFTEILRPERISYRSVPSDSAFWKGNPPPAYSGVIAERN